MTADMPYFQENRGLGIAFSLCALSILMLLANHPNGEAHGVAEVLKLEAQNRPIDAVVHGGFIAVQGVLAVCFALLSRRLESGAVLPIIGLLMFIFGCGALMASMLLDGFAIPAIAVRLTGVDTADNLLMAKTLLILFGTLIRFLMPMGMLFQGVAMLSWSAMIVTGGTGWRWGVGAFGFITASILMIAVLCTPATLAPHVLLGGIALQSLWYFGLAILLFGRGSRAQSSAVRSER